MFVVSVVPVVSKKKKLSAFVFRVSRDPSSFTDLLTLFVCFPGVFVFSQPSSGLYPPGFRGFLITHNDAPQSVGLLWTSDQSVAETST